MAEASRELLSTVHILFEQWRMQKTKEKTKGKEKEKEKGKRKSSGWRWKRRRSVLSCSPLFTFHVNNGECRRQRRK